MSSRNQSEFEEWFKDHVVPGQDEFEALFCFDLEMSESVLCAQNQMLIHMIQIVEESSGRGYYVGKIRKATAEDTSLDPATKQQVPLRHLQNKYFFTFKKI